MKSKRAFYFVDTENDGGSWYMIVNLIAAMKEKDRIYLVVTKHASRDTLLYCADHRKHIKIIHAENGTPNSLDFTLVSALARKTAKHPHARFIIISNDHGYDSTIRYLSSIGVNIQRIGSNEMESVASFAANYQSCMAASDSKNSIDQKNMTNGVCKGNPPDICKGTPAANKSKPASLDDLDIIPPTISQKAREVVVNACKKSGVHVVDAVNALKKDDISKYLLGHGYAQKNIQEFLCTVPKATRKKVKNNL